MAPRRSRRSARSQSSDTRPRPAWERAKLVEPDGVLGFHGEHGAGADRRPVMAVCHHGPEGVRELPLDLALPGRVRRAPHVGQHDARAPLLTVPGWHGQRDAGAVQLVDCCLDLGEFALAPVEAREGRPVRAVLGDVRAREVEQLDEQLGRQQGREWRRSGSGSPLPRPPRSPRRAGRRRRGSRRSSWLAASSWGHHIGTCEPIEYIFSTEILHL